MKVFCIHGIAKTVILNLTYKKLNKAKKKKKPNKHTKQTKNLSESKH